MRNPKRLTAGAASGGDDVGAIRGSSTRQIDHRKYHAQRRSQHLRDAESASDFPDLFRSSSFAPPAAAAYTATSTSRATRIKICHLQDSVSGVYWDFALGLGRRQS
jgi:hypothetical protein